jgi:starch phosphorylase
MAIMALANATFINGVSKLHAKVSRSMVQEGFSGIPRDEIPIGHVTNGIHIRSWISKDMSQLLDRYLGSAWVDDPVNLETWSGVECIPDIELWRSHERRRERLVSFVRARLRDQLTKVGASREQISRADEVLNPQVLTIGFSRRFATYKRATLLLKDPERLVRLLNHAEHPVQLIFSGKAHPHDDAGKEFIRQIVHFARNAGVRGRMVFLENYNMLLSRYLVQGVDAWLNCPRRPMEASGTSGMKVAVNGGINISILDGWWDEAYTPEVGWAIGAGEEYADPDYQDQVESNALYEVIEKEVVPLFYSRGRDELPRGWIRKMKASIRHLSPYFNTDRMVQEYNDRFYMVAKRHFERLSGDEFTLARNLANWKLLILRNWNQVRIESVTTDNQSGKLTVGEKLKVQATIRLGSLEPKDVTLELFAGPLDDHRQIKEGKAIPMELAQSLGDGRYVFSGDYPCKATGSHGLGVRLIPYHEDLATKYEMALTLWA